MYICELSGEFELDPGLGLDCDSYVVCKRVIDGCNVINIVYTVCLIILLL